MPTKREYRERNKLVEDTLAKERDDAFKLRDELSKTKTSLEKAQEQLKHVRDTLEYTEKGCAESFTVLRDENARLNQQLVDLQNERDEKTRLAMAQMAMGTGGQAPLSLSELDAYVSRGVLPPALVERDEPQPEPEVTGRKRWVREKATDQLWLVTTQLEQRDLYQLEGLYGNIGKQVDGYALARDFEDADQPTLSGLDLVEGEDGQVQYATNPNVPHGTTAFLPESIKDIVERTEPEAEDATSEPRTAPVDVVDWAAIDARLQQVIAQRAEEHAERMKAYDALAPERTDGWSAHKNELRSDLAILRSVRVKLDDVLGDPQFGVGRVRVQRANGLLGDVIASLTELTKED